MAHATEHGPKAGCTALAAALGGMPGAFHDDTTYPGFSWHVAGDPERLGAARQALATKKHARGNTAVQWEDEAVREIDDGSYTVWNELATLKAAHAWFMRVFGALKGPQGIRSLSQA